MISIIFVDDEVNLLEGLKRMLRKKKDDWDMTFVKSGLEALELFDKNKYDIIVTDYKMPGMDGIELLNSIKNKFSQTKRVILSGQSEAEIFNKAKEVSNVYISKPCDPDQLISILEKTSHNEYPVC